MATEEKQLDHFVCNHMKDIGLNDNTVVLEHIASCDICAVSYAEMIEKNSLIKAPHYMKSNILQKSSELVEKQNPYKIFEKRSKQFKLFQYSMKVGLAMCGALIMLFSSSLGTPFGNMTQNHIESKQQVEKYSVSPIIDKMNYGLREFSNNIAKYTDTLVSNNNDMEDNKNDKEKK